MTCQDVHVGDTVWAIVWAAHKRRAVATTITFSTAVQVCVAIPLMSSSYALPSH